MNRTVPALALLALSAVANAAGPALTPTDPAGLKKEIAKHKGKVVVLNFWATWCGPCKAEFPELVATARAKKADLVTLAFDERSDSGKASTFLEQNKQMTGALINKGGADFDPGYLKWLEPTQKDDVAIPRTYVFSPTGKLVKVLVGRQSTATFSAAIDAAAKVK